jgi:hypothetical protein
MNPSTTQDRPPVKRKTYVKIHSSKLPPKICECSRPGVKWTGDGWACEWCSNAPSAEEFLEH